MVVTLGRYIEVLEPSPAVEGDHLRLDLPVLDIDLVTDEADRNALTDPGQVLVPLGHVLIGDARADIEHDDSTVSSNATGGQKEPGDMDW